MAFSRIGDYLFHLIPGQVNIPAVIVRKAFRLTAAGGVSRIPCFPETAVSVADAVLCGCGKQAQLINKLINIPKFGNNDSYGFIFRFAFHL